MATTSSRVNFFWLLARLVTEARMIGIEVMPFWIHRTSEEQHALYLAGKSKCDGYERKSKHQDWLAADLVVIINGSPVWDHVPDYDRLGDIWKQIGGVWGGDWPSLHDIYHFEAGA